MRRLPSVDEVRPARCPRCGAPGRELNRPLGIIGHGVRARQLRGPTLPDDTPTVTTLLGRRYKCCPCGAVLTVVPRGVRYRRHYSAMAVAMAFALFGILGLSAATVRRRVNPWPTTLWPADWPTLRRWCHAERRRLPAGWSSRQIAERCAQEHLAVAPPSARHRAAPARAFLGGLHMP